jgi:hypothetical protein
MLNLVRELDPDTEQPVGYRLESGIDKMSAPDRTVFDKLNGRFSAHNLRGELKLGQNPTNQRLKQWEHLGVILHVGRGAWEKVPPAGGEQAEQEKQTQSNQPVICSEAAEQGSFGVNKVNCSVCSAPEGIVQEVVNK